MTVASSKPLILIIEDHPDIVEIVEYNLSREGFAVAHAYDGQEGLKKTSTLRPSLVLLDIMLPQMNGLEVCRLVRNAAETKLIPIIMLTAKGEESDIVRGLELGADDYITKPFSPKELVARVRSILRRSSNLDKTGVLRIKELILDSERHEVRVHNAPIGGLTLAEFRLLRALVSQVGRVLTRDQLIDRMSDEPVVIIDRNVDVHMSSLRKKLGDYGQYIVTVRGVGYRFVE